MIQGCLFNLRRMHLRDLHREGPLSWIMDIQTPALLAKKLYLLYVYLPICECSEVCLCSVLLGRVRSGWGGVHWYGALPHPPHDETSRDSGWWPPRPTQCYTAADSPSISGPSALRARPVGLMHTQGTKTCVLLEFPKWSYLFNVFEKIKNKIKNNVLEKNAQNNLFHNCQSIPKLNI